MQSFSARRLCLLTIVFLVASPAWRARAQELELDFGTSADGQIKANLEFPLTIELPVSIYRGIPGYARGDFGFHSTVLDEPDEDFFQFSPDANFEFILLAKSHGMEVWDDHGSGFLPVGGRFFVGPSPFDTHPIWNIPDMRQSGTLALTLRMHDMNGIYSDSDPITLSFTPLNRKGLIALGDPMLPTQRMVPEPAQALLVLVAATLQLIRRARSIC
jgi:hypothetical protein